MSAHELSICLVVLLCRYLYVVLPRPLVASVGNRLIICLVIGQLLYFFRQCPGIAFGEQ